MMKILVIAPLLQENFDQMQATFKQQTWIFSNAQEVTQEMIDDCDVIVGNPSLSFHLNRPSLRAIFLQSAGSDQYVQAGLLHPQTLLTNASGTYGNAIAEHTIGMILMLNKNLHLYHSHMQEQLWKPLKRGKELWHQTIVIVGLGDLGYTLAKRLKAFDCYVIGIKRRPAVCPPALDELYLTEQLDEVLPRADYVISCLPQTPETTHLFSFERFMKMKSDAVFVNVGRGSAVVTDDLATVLKKGHLYGAALDVTDPEPLPACHPLWGLENVLITPHVSGGYYWASAREHYTQLVISNLHHLLQGEALENEVDFQTGYRKQTMD